MTGRVHMIGWCVILSFQWAACGSDAAFSGHEALPSTGWLSSESASFEWQVRDTMTQHDFFIDLRHDQTYPFSNIYLFVDFTFPNGKSLRDTVACTLADDRGRWLGSGWGNLVDHRIGFKRNTSFPIPGDYSIEIVHGMRQNPLLGMRDVGFRLEASNPK
ncbi:MAG: gliding motility lipoprotein GldH [Bacteroidetes bacterium]|jgi:gliding motility-associated lipoprotein GldH|nr:gliding motility lipoprotein GldH [Bacteroidota bacterium]